MSLSLCPPDPNEPCSNGGIQFGDFALIELLLT
jgi:hypothetical protein